MKKKDKGNYLDFIPVKAPDIEYQTGGDGIVTVFIAGGNAWFGITPGTLVMMFTYTYTITNQFNFINSGHYQEALNLLNGIKTRNAQWYFYSAAANSGVGNNVIALQYAQEALRRAELRCGL